MSGSFIANSNHNPVVIDAGCDRRFLWSNQELDQLDRSFQRLQAAVGPTCDVMREFSKLCNEFGGVKPEDLQSLTIPPMNHVEVFEKPGKPLKFHQRINLNHRRRRRK